MDADVVRRTLIAQHDQIREHLAACTVLARRLRGGEAVHDELQALLGALRVDVGAHNQVETEVVHKLIGDSPDWGVALVARMLEAHLAEHRSFLNMLGGPLREVADRMDDLVDELDAHMAAEERTFLSPQVLREDVIVRHRRIDVGRA